MGQFCFNFIAIIALAILFFASVNGAPSTQAIVKVNYHVWYHPNPGSENSVIKDLTVQIENNSTFFKVMEGAAATNNQFYRFEYDTFPFGHYIKSIGGFNEVPSENTYWMIYKLTTNPDPKNPPSDDQLSEFGVDGILVADADTYLFWRRVVIF